jgi:hypothetical protein
MSTEQPMIGDDKPAPQKGSATAQKPREEDPRTRAARRALELREHSETAGDETDKFYIDPVIVPDGWTYEWKNHTIFGKSDPTYDVALARKGWDPVPAARHPELMPLGYKGNTILRDGQILMERPTEIVKESKDRDYRNAIGQVRGKEAQLAGAPQGTFDRDNKGTPMAKVHKTRESLAVPK